MNTIQQYNEVIAQCKGVFLHKAADYGTAWTILRMTSVTDQISIKAWRIRSIQETQVNLVGDSIESEFVGIINYCVIALMLLDRSEINDISQAYDSKVETARNTMMQKNHDYSEAWRNMRISSITDLILMKILRIKQIENNEGKTLVSEGVDANYIDMMNYAAFCLILMDSECIYNTTHTI